MIKTLLLGVAAAALLGSPLAAQTKVGGSANPLVAEWPGAWGGLPPFDKARVADLKPALESAMAAQMKEIEAIANNPAKPTFDNTLVAMERSGKTLGRVYTIYGVYTSNLATPDVQKVEGEMAPKLSAFQDSITQNARLFARIEAVWNSPDKPKWTPEQQRLAWVTYNNFVLAGAKLDPAQGRAVGGQPEARLALYEVQPERARRRRARHARAGQQGPARRAFAEPGQ